MKWVLGSQTCREHLWERGLEVHGGVECVVRSCRNCQRRELCWSRRPIWVKALYDVGIELVEEEEEVLTTRNRIVIQR
jgi:hypothetical protein